MRKKDGVKRVEEVKMVEKERDVVEVNELIGLPVEVARLGIEAQYLLFNYVEGGDFFGFGDMEKNILFSYIMCFHNAEEIANSVWSVKKSLMYDARGEVIGEHTDLIVKDRMLYAKWKMRAVKFWNDNNLESHLQSVRDILVGNVSREKEFEDAIFNDAMNGETPAIRNTNRKMYMEIKGMKNVKKTRDINVYTRGGGKERSESLKDTLGIDKFSISDILEVDFEGDD